jgi:7-carboxy-7-deazaguanine synthase
MNDTVVVNEIYLSIQGESTFAGLPCVFVRLTACNLRCSYCDTAYAFSEGKRFSLGAIRARIAELAKPFVGCVMAGAAGIPSLTGQIGPNGLPAFGRTTGTTELPRSIRLPLVELTGGEPLLQPGTIPLTKALRDDGFTVLVETSGALDIAPLDPSVRRIMDLKCPSSGESERNRWENLTHLTHTDEIKFVIGTQGDYDWAKAQLAKFKLASICPVLFSWVTPLQPHQQDKSLKGVPAGHKPLSRLELVEKIIADALPVRFQLQMHKFIWPPDQRGV